MQGPRGPNRSIVHIEIDDSCSDPMLFIIHFYTSLRPWVLYLNFYLLRHCPTPLTAGHKFCFIRTFNHSACCTSPPPPCRMPACNYLLSSSLASSSQTPGLPPADVAHSPSQPYTARQHAPPPPSSLLALAQTERDIHRVACYVGERIPKPRGSIHSCRRRALLIILPVIGMLHCMLPLLNGRDA